MDHVGAGDLPRHWDNLDPERPGLSWTIWTCLGSFGLRYALELPRKKQMLYEFRRVCM